MRYDSLDILRGFALLGLPLLNIVSFSMPFAAYLNPYAYAGDSLLNHSVFSFLQITANQKFYGIFSILFGASMVLLASKVNSAQSSASFMAQRLFWLFVFGIMHMLFLWEGDILTTYAVIGILIFWLRNYSILTLSILWILLVLLSCWFAYQVDAYSIDLTDSQYESVQYFYQPSQEQIYTFLEGIRGTYLSVMGETTWKETTEAYTAGDQILLSFTMASLFKIVSLMLLGMILFKAGALQMQRSRRFYMLLAALGITFGYSLSIYALVYLYASDFDARVFFYLGDFLLLISSYITTLGYIGLIGLLIKLAVCQKAFFLLSHAGRLAFTNYIMQSVICALIFYGYAGGLAGYLNRLELLLIALSIGAFQLAFSAWWIKRFYQGPLEWLWRSLCGMKWQAFKRATD
jgi:uncharacterized protein